MRISRRIVKSEIKAEGVNHSRLRGISSKELVRIKNDLARAKAGDFVLIKEGIYYIKDILLVGVI